MSLPEIIKYQLILLVTAQCKAGIVVSFTALNTCTIEQLRELIIQSCNFCIYQICHASNAGLNTYS